MGQVFFKATYVRKCHSVKTKSHQSDVNTFAFAKPLHCNRITFQPHIYRFCNHRRKVPREIEEMHCFSRNVTTRFRGGLPEISPLQHSIIKMVIIVLSSTVLHPCFFGRGPLASTQQRFLCVEPCVP